MSMSNPYGIAPISSGEPMGTMGPREALPQPTTFAALKVCFSGFEDQKAANERAKLAALVEQHGGEVTATLDSNVSVLICYRAGTAKFEAARREGIPTLKAAWLVESAANRAMIGADADGAGNAADESGSTPGVKRVRLERDVNPAAADGSPSFAASQQAFSMHVHDRNNGAAAGPGRTIPVSVPDRFIAKVLFKLKICSTGFNSEANSMIESRVTELDGVFTRTLTPDVTVLVVPNDSAETQQSRKVEFARKPPAPATHSIPTVLPKVFRLLGEGWQFSDACAEARAFKATARLAPQLDAAAQQPLRTAMPQPQVQHHNSPNAHLEPARNGDSSMSNSRLANNNGNSNTNGSNGSNGSRVTSVSRSGANNNSNSKPSSARLRPIKSTTGSAALKTSAAPNAQLDQLLSGQQSGVPALLTPGSVLICGVGLDMPESYELRRVVLNSVALRRVPTVTPQTQYVVVGSLLNPAGRQDDDSNKTSHAAPTPDMQAVGAAQQQLRAMLVGLQFPLTRVVGMDWIRQAAANLDQLQKQFGRVDSFAEGGVPAALLPKTDPIQLRGPVASAVGSAANGDNGAALRVPSVRTNTAFVASPLPEALANNGANPTLLPPGPPGEQPNGTAEDGNGAAADAQPELRHVHGEAIRRHPRVKALIRTVGEASTPVFAGKKFSLDPRFHEEGRTVAGAMVAWGEGSLVPFNSSTNGETPETDFVVVPHASEQRWGSAGFSGAAFSAIPTVPNNTDASNSSEKSTTSKNAAKEITTDWVFASLMNLRCLPLRLLFSFTMPMARVLEPKVVVDAVRNVKAPQQRLRGSKEDVAAQQQQQHLRMPSPFVLAEGKRHAKAAGEGGVCISLALPQPQFDGAPVDNLPSVLQGVIETLRGVRSKHLAPDRVTHVVTTAVVAQGARALVEEIGAGDVLQAAAMIESRYASTQEVIASTNNQNKSSSVARETAGSRAGSSARPLRGGSMSGTPLKKAAVEDGGVSPQLRSVSHKQQQPHHHSRANLRHPASRSASKMRPMPTPEETVVLAWAANTDPKSPHRGTITVILQDWLRVSATVGYFVVEEADWVLLPAAAPQQQESIKKSPSLGRVGAPGRNVMVPAPPTPQRPCGVSNPTASKLHTALSAIQQLDAAAMPATPFKQADHQQPEADYHQNNVDGASPNARDPPPPPAFLGSSPAVDDRGRSGSSVDNVEHVYFLSTVPKVGDLQKELRAVAEAIDLNEKQNGGGRRVRRGLVLGSGTGNYVSATVMVCDDIALRESVLVGVAGGKHLVTPAYVKACVDERAMVDPARYHWTPELLQEKANAAKAELHVPHSAAALKKIEKAVQNGAKLLAAAAHWRQMRESGAPGPFDGFQVLFWGVPAASADAFQYLIECGGGSRAHLTEECDEDVSSLMDAASMFQVTHILTSNGFWTSRRDAFNAEATRRSLSPMHNAGDDDWPPAYRVIVSTFLKEMLFNDAQAAEGGAVWSPAS